MNSRQLIQAGERMEFVGGRNKSLSGEDGDHPRCARVKALRRVQARAHRRSAQRQFAKRAHQGAEHLFVPFQTGPPAGDLL